jgi:hypothetical protein
LLRPRNARDHDVGREGELLSDDVRREAFAEASRFRGEFSACLTKRRDELFELADAVLCGDGPVKFPVDVTLLPEHRRGYGALYGGLHRGRIDVEQLRRVLAGLSLLRFPDGRLVPTVDVAPWLRSDAPCSAERLFCHVYGRAKSASLFIPGWPYSFVAVLEPGATPWTAILDAARLGPADHATAVTAARLRGVVERLIAKGQWASGAPDIMVVADAGYDVTRGVVEPGHPLRSEDPAPLRHRLNHHPNGQRSTDWPLVSPSPEQVVRHAARAGHDLEVEPVKQLIR